MENAQVSTIETQNLIYKRRVQRLHITKGVSRGKLIDRVNASSEDKKFLPRKIPPKEKTMVP